MDPVTRSAQSIKLMFSTLCRQTSGYNRACWSSTSSIRMCQALFADVGTANSGTYVQVHVYNVDIVSSTVETLRTSRDPDVLPSFLLSSCCFLPLLHLCCRSAFLPGCRSLTNFWNCNGQVVLMYCPVTI